MGMTQFLMQNTVSRDVASWLTDLLQESGLHVLPSFNLRTALAEDGPRTCPHHPHESDSEMSVLLVYGPDPRPVTIMAYSSADYTWISLSDSLDEGLLSDLQRQIKSLLAASENAVSRP